MVKFLDLRSQYLGIKDEIDAAIEAVVSSCNFVGGAPIAAFEKVFADYQQAEYCVGVGNGTDAIEIAIESLGLPPGSEILVPANSFIASSEAVTRSGYQVIFCDIDGSTFLMDLADAEQRVTDRTRAIICVHLYGRPCDMDALKIFAARHGLRVIEDAAQAHGAMWNGRRVGAIGDIGTFSFYPGKNLGAYGDGGAIVTNDAVLAKRARMIANHGRIDKYNHEFEGRNSRLDTLQAAILSCKLGHLEAWIERRNAVARRYLDRLEGLRGIALPTLDDRFRHAFHLFVVRSSRRDALKMHLEDRGIQTGIHYPISLPRLAAYAHNPSAQQPFVADGIAGEILSLPMGEHLSDAHVDEVADAVAAFCADQA